MRLLKLTIILFALSYGEAHANMPKEEKIWLGCTQKAEMTFYIAQEKLYNSGTADKLLNFLKQNMSAAGYEVMKRQYRRLAEWVDGHEFNTAKDYSRNLMYACVTNSYKYFDLDPTDKAKVFSQRFEAIVNSVDELPRGMQMN